MHVDCSTHSPPVPGVPVLLCICVRVLILSLCCNLFEGRAIPIVGTQQCYIERANLASDHEVSLLVGTCEGKWMTHKSNRILAFLPSGDSPPQRSHWAITAFHCFLPLFPFVFSFPKGKPCDQSQPRPAHEVEFDIHNTVCGQMAGAEDSPPSPPRSTSLVPIRKLTTCPSF